MTHLTRRRFRRYAAAALAPLILLLSACGIQQDIVIHENDTADVTIIAWGEEVTEDKCTSYGDQVKSEEPDLKVAVEFTEFKGKPACKATSVGLSLQDAGKSGNKVRITHEDGLYKVDMDVEDSTSQGADISQDLEIVATITFPGDVTEATGKTAKTEGNKVTWSNLQEEKGTTLHAEGYDSPGLPWLWIAVGAVVALLVIGGIVALIVLRKRSAKTQGYTPQNEAAPGPQGASTQAGYGVGYNPNQPYSPAGDYQAVPEPGYQGGAQPNAAVPGAQQPGGYQQQPGQVGQPSPFQQPGGFQQPGAPSAPTSAPSAPGSAQFSTPSGPSVPASGNPADSMATQALPQGHEHQALQQPAQPSGPSVPASGNPADSMPTQALPQGQQALYQQPGYGQQPSQPPRYGQQQPYNPNDPRNAG